MLQCPAGDRPARAAVSAVRRSRRSRRGAARRRRDDRRLHRGAGRIAGSGTPQGGPTRGPQNVFINRRIVKDRTIAHAILDAYSVASIKERSPEVHLFIEMPREAVDVNVHPTKAEVRFRDQSYIHQVVRRALADTLGRGPAPELTLDAPRVRHRAAGHAAAAGRLRRGLSKPVAAGRASAGGATQSTQLIPRPPHPGVTGAPTPSTFDRARRLARCGDSPFAPPACRSHRRRRSGPSDPARPVPRHVHHCRGRGRDRDHRSARRARTRAVRTDCSSG